MKILLYLSDSSLPWDLLNSVEYMLLCACHTLRGLPWWFSGKESTCNAGDPGSVPGLEDFLEESMATQASILAGESHGQKPGDLRSMGSQKSRTLLKQFCTHK